MKPEVTQALTLPESYTFRPTRLQDAEGVVKLWGTVSAENGITSQASPDNFRAEWEEPKFELESSSRVVVDSHGQVLGYGIRWDNSDLPVDPWLIFYSHPEYKEQGIDTHLLNWLEQTAERVIERCPSDTQIKYRSLCNSEAVDRQQVLESCRYRVI